MEEEKELTQEGEPTEAAETVEEPDYKQLYEEAKAEAERLRNLESQNKGLQRELHRVRQNFIRKEDLTAHEDRLVRALDVALQQRLRDSDEYEEEKPKRPPSLTELIREAREAEAKTAKPQEPEYPPDVVLAGQVALDICQENGWNETSPQYRKALELGPVDGLKYLYKEATKVAAEKAKEQAQLERKKAIKEGGGTASATGPSAAGLDLEELRRRYNADPYDPKIAREWESRRDEFYAMRRKDEYHYHL